MRNLDLVKFVEGVHEYIGKALAPLAQKLADLDQHVSNSISLLSDTFGEHLKRITALEEREPQKGQDGKDADEDAIVERLKADWQDRFEGIKGEFLAMLPPAFDPAPMKAELASELRATATEEVRSAVDALPKPKDGEDGKSFTLEDAIPVIERAIESVVSKWALDFERRGMDTLQRMADRMPAAKDGADGLGFEDMRIEHDGERKFALVFERGERVVRKDFTIPAVIDRGYFIQGKTAACEPGDGYTFGGSYWICQEATDSEPSTENKAWRLAVRRGRDSRQPVEFRPKREGGPVKLGEAD